MRRSDCGPRQDAWPAGRRRPGVPGGGACCAGAPDGAPNQRPTAPGPTPDPPRLAPGPRPPTPDPRPPPWRRRRHAAVKNAFTSRSPSAYNGLTDSNPMELNASANGRLAQAELRLTPNAV